MEERRDSHLAGGMEFNDNNTKNHGLLYIFVFCEKNAVFYFYCTCTGLFGHHFEPREIEDDVGTHGVCSVPRRNAQNL